MLDAESEMCELNVDGTYNLSLVWRAHARVYCVHMAVSCNGMRVRVLAVEIWRRLFIRIACIDDTTGRRSQYAAPPMAVAQCEDMRRRRRRWPLLQWPTKTL